MCSAREDRTDRMENERPIMRKPFSGRPKFKKLQPIILFCNYTINHPLLMYFFHIGPLYSRGINTSSSL